MVEHYLDAGGNFIDTANFYAAGESERMLGDILGQRRSSVVISSKYSLGMVKGDPNASGNHRKNMIQSIEASLKRLKTDYLDLLYLHLWDNRTPVEEILRAFDDLVSSGKILYAGISDTPAWQISRMQAIADLRGWTPLVALQIPYNLTERTVEREFMPMAHEMGLGIMPWSPLAGGVLSGKYTRSDLEKEAADYSSRKDINKATGRLTARALDIADVVNDIAAELHCEPAQIALAWTMQHAAITSPVIGARTLAQLQSNLGALDIRFNGDQLSRLQKVSHVDTVFPHTMIDTDTGNMMLGNIEVELRKFT
jgi:aryl-alcohol dehydrogenase-like predicted oxidoreductase